jgi:flavin reductase (DIM6/NTAB) family NADH-FMN oxidoreductase RutF
MEQKLYREAMARWASGVAVVACRHEGRVIATTVSAFLSLSLEPPLVLLALGTNATVMPFLSVAAPFGISILGGSQRRLASVFADPFPAITDPFPAADPPLLPEALVRLHCTVRETRTGGDHLVVIAAVDDVHFTDAAPLIRFRRRYHALASS